MQKIDWATAFYSLNFGCLHSCNFSLFNLQLLNLLCNSSKCLSQLRPLSLQNKHTCPLFFRRWLFVGRVTAAKWLLPQFTKVTHWNSISLGLILSRSQIAKTANWDSIFRTSIIKFFCNDFNLTNVTDIYASIYIMVLTGDLGVNLAQFRQNDCPFAIQLSQLSVTMLLWLPITEVIVILGIWEAIRPSYLIQMLITLSISFWYQKVLLILLIRNLFMYLNSLFDRPNELSN